VSGGRWFRVIKGWLAGCAAATAVFIVAFAWLLVARPSIYGGELNGPSGGIAAVLVSGFLIFPVTCLLTGFPAAAVVWLSERIAIRSVWFFACAGAGIGVLIATVLAVLFSTGGAALLASLYAVPGFAAGVAYWRVSGRYAGNLAPREGA
jgi:hypothetical protein